jgi:GT2 family glycosyltransferase
VHGLVGGFDESFDYGSDIDFSWRLRDAGVRLRSVPEARVEHDWGSHSRQLRRAFRYGQARRQLPFATLTDHLAYGAGVLTHVTRQVTDR